MEFQVYKSDKIHIQYSLSKKLFSSAKLLLKQNTGYIYLNIKNIDGKMYMFKLKAVLPISVKSRPFDACF